MKKQRILLLLSVLMLCISLSSLATTNADRFEAITLEGYQTSLEKSDFFDQIIYSPTDTTKAEYILTIAYNEVYQGKTLADLTTAEYDELVTLLSLNYNAPTVTKLKTAMGTPVIIVDESNSESDFTTITTIFQGFVLEMRIAYRDYQTVTQNDIDFGVKIFSDMNFAE